MNFIDLFSRGGLMTWALLACALAAIVISAELFILFKKTKINVPAFSLRIRGFLKQNNIDGAIDFCLEEKSPVSIIIRRGLKKYKTGGRKVLSAIKTARKQEYLKLGKRLPILSTLAGAAPMIGFLGMISGAIRLLVSLREAEVIIDNRELYLKIYESLLPAAAGLILGIAILFLHAYFRSALNKIILEMDIVLNDIADLIEASAGDEVAAGEDSDALDEDSDNI